MTLGTETHLEGLIVLDSRRPVEEVVARLKQAMATRNLRIFAELDFSADAAAEGLELRPTRMLIAGNPKAGTPLIEAVATSAIDLPLKVLVWSQSDVGTCVAYNDPQYLGRRHGLSAELIRNIAGLGALVEAAAGGAP
ncbi:MAG TPA: DUF302 domain-containing protein [Steroidobacteraceae bacterium]|nr:DUF302 domain-containing protein [Steroidobacteraceae bacterium]